MILRQIFNSNAIVMNLHAENKNEAFEELINELVLSNPNMNKSVVLQAVLDRESKMTTGIQHGVGVPHGRTDQVDGVKGIIGISQKGIGYNSLDGSPVNLIFMVISNPDAVEDHLVAIQRLAQLLMDPDFFDDVLNCKDSQEVYDLICRYEDGL